MMLHLVSSILQMGVSGSISCLAENNILLDYTVCIDICYPHQLI